MTFILAGLLSFILTYRYAGFFLISFLSAVGLPFPSVTLLIASAAFASQGYLNLSLIIILNVVANILGDLILYWAARKWRQQIFTWKWFKFVLPHNRIERISLFLEKHPFIAIFFSRFVGVTTTVVDLLLGLIDFPFIHFLAWDIVGEIATGIFYAFIGYLFGSNWIYITPVLDKIGDAIAIILALILLWKFVLEPKRRHKQSV